MTLNRIRHEVWERMERGHLVLHPRPCYYRVPNFAGAGEAARRLSALPEFEAANCVLCTRDTVLEEVRRCVLSSGRRLPLIHQGGLWEVAGIAPEDYDTLLWLSRVAELGRPLASRVALIVVGSIAVDRHGVRVGRREDPEEALLRALIGTACVPESAPVATIVHEAQVYERIPARGVRHPRLDLIVTPERVLRPGEEHR